MLVVEGGKDGEAGNGAAVVSAARSAVLKAKAVKATRGVGSKGGKGGCVSSMAVEVVMRTVDEYRISRQD